MNAKRFYKAHATGYPLHSRLKWRGLNISIENGVGSVREGVDGNGKPWRVRMKVPYVHTKHRIAGRRSPGRVCRPQPVER